MKAFRAQLITSLLGLFALHATAATRYVNLNNPTPAAPFTTWNTAATQIQDAVDAAMDGDLVLVTNGVYRTGGRVVDASLTNRVAVTKPLTVRSVNGPAVTVIQGFQVPETIKGASSVRCVYLTNGAALIGFTVTNGASREISGEPPVSWMGGGGVFCESSTAWVSNCVIVGNAAGQGGGVYGGTVNNCILKDNQGEWYGGGASGSILSNCALNGNTAGYGGGAVFATLNNCTLTANSPNGADSCTLNNCILFYNTPANHTGAFGGCTLNYCCTTPLPGDGTGNISVEPQLSSASHLSTGSPCLGAGNAAFATGVDLDGDTWLSPPAIGCDEFNANLAGPLAVALEISLTNVAVGFPVRFNAQIEGPTTASRWDFSDGTIVSNRPFGALHSWAAPGDYPVILSAYNQSFPGGVSVTGLVHVVEETHYVSLSSANPVSPYLSWATAATNIQDAADVASLPGALVLVTNGVYGIGARAVYGTMTNRVVVDKPARVQSVNGPGVTVIQGYQLPGTTNGDGAIRCVYLTNDAVLSGFTLTGGATRSDGDGETEQGGGGVWCESPSAVVSNCVLVGNAAAYVGGGARSGTLVNCTLSGNWANYGGGAYASTLNDCWLTNNTAGDQGGGTYGATLNGCTLLANTAPNGGGGVSSSTLNSCSLTSNSANYGGGAQDSTLNDCNLTGNWAYGGGGGGANGGTLHNCRLSENEAADSGGGAQNATLNHCLLSGNTATNYGGGVNSCTVQTSLLTGNAAGLSGGGAAGGTLNNCTLTGNSATSGGGANGVTLNNCIIFYNTAGRDPNHTGSGLNYCSTTPLPPSGAGNISAQPQLTDSSHLAANSPCRGAGSSAFASGTDLDGEVWLNPPSIGCDEYFAGTVTGALSVAISAAFTNVASGFAVDLAGLINGHATASRWNFGDGSGVVSNQLNTAHSWASAGDYLVVLEAFNDSNPAGVSATLTVHVVAQSVHYVAPGSLTPVAPFSSWATAATNIQDAVDAATVPGALVLVTNGNFQFGGRVVFGALTNRVVIDKPLTVQSVNGPAVTVIQGTPTNGDSAVRCVLLGSSATLSGFTLTGGATRTDGDGDQEQSGGAVWCGSVSGVVSNCVLTANTANSVGGAVIGGTLFNCLLSTNSAGAGGAVCQAELNDCQLTGNYAGDSGGAAYAASLTRCSLIANAAANTGGGAYVCSLFNCTLSGNSATNYGGGVNGGVLSGCALTGNSSGYSSGGAEGATLNHCTLTANTALYGGGANSCTLNNCILQFNLAPQQANYAGGTLNFCCTTPLPVAGTGNFTADPQLAGAIHLSAGSPCRGMGSAAYSSGVDIDGEAWANPPSVGCDEYHVGALTGSMTVAIQAAYTNCATGFEVGFTALISGRVSDSSWNFGDGTIVSNLPYASHRWAAPGDYLVVLRAYNESNPAGISATVTVHVVSQPVHYVVLGNLTPVAPYASWLTAAPNIQQAVDAATVAGALVVVSNGIYQTGGRVVIEATNRVAITKPLIVRSLNGPGVTQINGNGEVRCAYVGSGAILSGFTLTNGVAGNFDVIDASERNGGGVRCESLSAVLTNCIVSGCSGNGGGGGVISGTLLDCTLAGNSIAYGGGGASYAMLNNCTLTNNSAWAGGAASGSTLNNCLLTGNGAWYGGGVDWCSLNNCTLTGNSGGNGGAANNSTLTQCLISGNSATYWAGGALNGTLDNCILTGNHADSGGAALEAVLRNCLLSGNTAGNGGGAVGGALTNCTITGNSAGAGGGVNGSVLANSIVYYNTAPSEPNYTGSSSLNYCSAWPVPPDGVGNLVADPQLASLTRISAASPCLGAGNAAFASGRDIDGEPWASPPAIGCDEYYSGALTGLVTVACSANYTNVAVGIPDLLTSQITGLVTASRWEFGDGTIVSNQPIVAYTWTSAGDFSVVLRAYNETYPAGMSATQVVHVLLNPVQYVAWNSATPTAPYLSWATAATNIQDAVDAAYVGGRIIVSDGIYEAGSSVVSGETNRVALTRLMSLESVGGPAVTVINGANVMRGVYLAAGTALQGFTITNCATPGNGGGVLCETATVIVSNCVLTGNSAASGGGGGVYGGTVQNCVLRGNTGANGAGAGNATLSQCQLLNNSGGNGGGANGCTLNYCTLSGNYAYSPFTGGGGGGAYGSTLNNCLVISNAAPIWGGGAFGSTLINCTVVGNYGGQRGAGLFEGAAYNSILYYNYIYGGTYEDYAAQYWWRIYISDSCTTPMPGYGGGNITDPPQFVNLAGGDFRLQSNSPCINAGNNGSVSAGSTDLDGNRRIVNGTVDIGAYEFIPPDLADFFAWLPQYGLPTDGSADYADTDGDGANNWQEWRADTIPTNVLSVLRMVSAANVPSGVEVTWQSVATRSYWLERATNLGIASPFQGIATNIIGVVGNSTYTDLSATNGGPYFYRVGVQ